MRSKRVAIPGMGGVGGFHLLTLVRLGIGSFNISDMDVFEVANFNRQIGADMSTIGFEKSEVMAEKARLINPELDIKTFPEGISKDNLDAFLEGVDLAIDGFDVFVLNMRFLFFKACHDKGIPVITAGPFGMGTAYLNFMPGKMSFADYFGLSEDMPEEEKILHFVAGFAPAALHRASLVEPWRLDINAKKAPSTPMGCSLAAGVAGAEALKILLGRGKLKAVPHYHHFDAYTGRWKKGFVPFGAKNPLQRLKLHMEKKHLADLKQQEKLRDTQKPIETDDEIVAILDMARWAPSGDNSQPWRFERTGDSAVRIHLRLGGDNNVYELGDGIPVYQSAGTLLESARLAAADFGRKLVWALEDECETGFKIAVDLPKDASVQPEKLAKFIKERSVNRYPFKLKSLDDTAIQALEQSVGDDFSIQWHLDLKDRWNIVKVNAIGTDIRLSIPEAYPVHKKILDWDHKLSENAIPDAATGLSPLTRMLMRKIMKKWERVRFMNTYMGGTLMPRLEMDVLPGLLCAAHFTLFAKSEKKPTKEDFIASGMAIQRFWLTATELGLALHPGYAPIVFSFYGRNKIDFTKDGRARKMAELLDKKCTEIWNGKPEHVRFQGRIGYAQARKAFGRSIRKPLDDLWYRGEKTK